MGLLIDSDDFIGTYALSQTVESNIDAYIDKYESKYLSLLLGAELYKLFKANVDGPTQKPIAARFLAIYDPILEDANWGVMQSEGMKSMLLGFIWWEFVRIEAYEHTATGVVNNSNELSTKATWTSGFIHKRYNESVKDHKVIRWFILDDSPTYPEYEGQDKRYAMSL